MRLVALRSMESGDADSNEDHRDDDRKDASTGNNGLRGVAAGTAVAGTAASPVRDRSDSVVSTASETYHRRMSRNWSSREARTLLLRGEEPAGVAEAAGAAALSPSPLRSTGLRSGGGGDGGLL